MVRKIAELGLLLLAGLGVAGCRPAQRPNVLLVTFDTTRADHLGCYGFPLARTPHLDRLATEGVRVTDDVSAAPITLPSHTSIMTGLFPPAHGVRDNGTYTLAPEAVTLAERFHDAGYATQAFVSAIVLDRRYGLAQGFDGYDDDLWGEQDPKLFMIRDRPAAATAERAVDWLDRWAADTDRRPFFLWVHFFDPHQPYDPPPEFRPLAASTYDAEISAADAGLGQVLDALERHGALDDTLVVATADHGESLGEHGEKTHAIFVYDATVHVPLLLRWPGRLPAGSTYSGPVRSVDLFPTLLAAAHLAPGDVQGEDLLPLLRDDGDERAPTPRPQYVESLVSEVGFGMAPLLGVRSGGYKWIRAPRPELYDLRTDPHELRDLSGSLPRVASQLEHQLSGILDASRRWHLHGQIDPLDSETLENLRALGYLASPAERRSMGGMDPKDGMVLYDRLEEARRLAQRDRWPEAEKQLRSLLDELPGNVSARNVLALSRLRQEDPDEAREQYLRSLADDPTQARVYSMLGVLDLLDGDLDSAERRMHQAIEISPGFVEAISNLGMVAALRGDPAGAEDWYRKAMAADPHFPPLHRRLGDLHYERGEFAAALEEYRRTLEAKPDDFDALVQAGNSARRTGDPAEAEAYFVRAQEVRPESWVPTYNRACLAALGGDPGEATRLLAAAIDLGMLDARLLRQDPDLESIRRRDQLRPLLAKIAAYRTG